MTTNILKDAAQREAAVLQSLQRAGATELRRAADVVGVNLETRTVDLAFSSEAEVRRYFGVEILSHDAGACRLDRLNDGAALLWSHKWDDQRGVVVAGSARVDDDRIGRCTIKLSRSVAGEELLQDIADGIKTKVSFGYSVIALKLTEEREGVDVYTVTEWEPYEVSIVAVPADVTVGVGRSAEIADVEPVERGRETGAASATADIETIPNQGDDIRMKTKNIRNAAGDLVRAEVDDDGNVVREIEVIERAGDAQRNARETGASAERARVRALDDMAERYGASVDNIDQLVGAARRDGTSAEAFQGVLLDAVSARAAKPLNEQLAGADVGMTEREIGQYSMLKVARALSDPSNRQAREAAAFEFELSDAARAKQATQTDRFVVPTDVLRAPIGGQRALNTGTGGNAANGSTGGNLVATNLLAMSFIDILRAKSTILSRAFVLGGLVGNVEIPKKVTAGQTFWINAEGDNAANTGVALGVVPMSPKTIGAYTDVTRRMVMQSSMDVEAMLRADLAIAQALGIDLAGYYGTGAAGQPLGITLQSGVNVVDFAAAGAPTFVELVKMESEIAIDNADVDSLQYVGNAKFRGHCKTTEKFAGTGQTLWEPGGTVNGYGALITNQIADGDVVLVNYQDVIVGMWGGLELKTDEAALALSGGKRLITFQDVDIALRHSQSVCVGRMIP